LRRKGWLVMHAGMPETSKKTLSLFMVDLTQSLPYSSQSKFIGGYSLHLSLYAIAGIG